MNKEGFSKYCHECNIKNVNYDPAERLRQEDLLATKLISLIDTLDIEDQTETKTIEESQLYYGMSIARDNYFSNDENRSFTKYDINFVANNSSQKHVTIGEGYGKNYISFAAGVEENLDQLKELVEYLVCELKH